jgi:hypothetical protein
MNKLPLSEIIFAPILLGLSVGILYASWVLL